MYGYRYGHGVGMETNTSPRKMKCEGRKQAMDPGLLLSGTKKSN